MGSAARTKLGPKFSEGTRLLWLACIEHGWEQRDLRALLNCSTGTVSRYLWGDRVPDRVMAEKIREIAGVPTPTWDQPPTEAFVPPAKIEPQQVA